MHAVSTMFACPAAAMTMSASRTILCESRVKEWTMVTVASAFRRSSDTGRPAILLRPTTTARLPLTVTPLLDRSSRHPCKENGAAYQSSRKKVKFSNVIDSDVP